ncbi:MAG: hypothetical protein AAF567_03715 [Actinomycetota bacterium]
MRRIVRPPSTPGRADAPRARPTSTPGGRLHVRSIGAAAGNAAARRFVHDGATPQVRRTDPRLDLVQRLTIGDEEIADKDIVTYLADRLLKQTVFTESVGSGGARRRAAEEIAGRLAERHGYRARVFGDESQFIGRLIRDAMLLTKELPEFVGEDRHDFEGFHLDSGKAPIQTGRPLTIYRTMPVDAFEKQEWYGHGGSFGQAAHYLAESRKSYGTTAGKKHDSVLVEFELTITDENILGVAGSGGEASRASSSGVYAKSEQNDIFRAAKEPGQIFSIGMKGIEDLLVRPPRALAFANPARHGPTGELTSGTSVPSNVEARRGHDVVQKGGRWFDPADERIRGEGQCFWDSLIQHGVGAEHLQWAAGDAAATFDGDVGNGEIQGILDALNIYTGDEHLNETTHVWGIRLHTIPYGAPENAISEIFGGPEVTDWIDLALFASLEEERGHYVPPSA